MSDISQHGLICTLQRLNENPELEAELAELTRARPVVLVLPCHASELERPALSGILRELSRESQDGEKSAAQPDFLSEVLIPMNGLDSDGFLRAQAFFRQRLAVPHRVLWCDAVADGFRALVPGFASGKGSNVWLATGALVREAKCAFVLMADADVTTFRREMLARLAFSLAHPSLGYAFAKSYYPRVTDRIYGRVSRLFFAPLLQALVRTGGHQPLLDFLRSFRYPLAGECGFTRALAGSLPFETGWGLETGMLCDLFRHTDPRDVCQVDAGGRYDHKHQPLGDGERGLVRMCGEIARTLFGRLAREGIRLDPPFLASVLSSYKKEAAEAVRRSAALSKINALRFEPGDEEAAVASFETALRLAFEKPGHTQTLPAWNAVLDAPAAGSNESAGFAQMLDALPGRARQGEEAHGYSRIL